MKTKTKIAAAAAVTLVAGAAFYAVPASAHNRTFTGSASSSSATVQQQKGFDHATLSATVTGIPTTVTSSHLASHGAYFTAYVLEDSATSLPASQPTIGGHRIGLMPQRNADGTFSDVLSGTTLTGVVGFHADADGTSKIALYPSDGTAAILVTVTTASDGKVSVTSSKALTVAYSATVAAEAPAKGMGPGKGMRGGKQGGHGKRGGHGAGQGTNFSAEDLTTPNA